MGVVGAWLGEFDAGVGEGDLGAWGGEGTVAGEVAGGGLAGVVGTGVVGVVGVVGPGVVGVVGAGPSLQAPQVPVTAVMALARAEAVTVTTDSATAEE
jgi:hypothetical protein